MRVRKTKGLSIFFAMFLSLGMWSMPVLARGWMLVGAQGDTPPNRTVFYSEFEALSDRVDMPLGENGGGFDAFAIDKHRYWRVNVVQVLENAAAPDTIAYVVGVKCSTQQMRLEEATAWGRDGRSQQAKQTEWSRIGEGWPSRVFMIACDRKKFDKAIEKARGGRIDALTDLGFVYVGDHMLPTELSDATWTTFWKDGVRPKYTTTLSAAELEAKRRQALERLDEAKITVEAAKKEAEFMQWVSNNFDKKSDAHKQVFAGMQGWTEQQVAMAWGAPDQSMREGEVHRAVYGYDASRTRVVDVKVDVLGWSGGAFGKVGETSQPQIQNVAQACSRTLFFREGGGKPGYRLFDYAVECR